MHLRTLCIILFITIISRVNTIKEKVEEWRLVEMLAEEHPYIVALLDITKDFICSGTTISRRTILTSGYCTEPQPTFVAAGLAVVSRKQPKNLLNVAYTKLHSDYTYVMRDTEPNVTKMHSNIGLVFVSRPVLTLYLPAAQVGSYYASELRDVELASIGFGRGIEDDLIMLQYQYYDQSPCANPRWYYCVCGVEVPSKHPTYGKDFGSGAPALYGMDVVGITAIPTGTLTLKTGLKYNIFTVIGPYIPWIEKTEGVAMLVSAESNDGHISYDHTLLHIVGMVLVVR